MANKEFHELITAEELSASDVIAEQRNNSGTWLTRKLTFNSLGLFLNKMLNYASDLHTTSKTIIGAINELAQGSGQSLDTLNDVDIDDQTLADGQGIVYDAMAQKWKNGAVSGGHTYSTTEKVVGTWIDGSPVYERTFVSNALVSGNNEVGDFSDITPSLVWVEKGFVVSQGASVPNMYYTDNDADHIKIYTRLTDNTVRCICSNYYVGGICYAIIRYTKSST
jgi:hypothetical protein